MKVKVILDLEDDCFKDAVKKALQKSLQREMNRNFPSLVKEAVRDIAEIEFTKFMNRKKR